MVDRSKTAEILEYILPLLKIASAYSTRIQSAIGLHPEKDSTNIFAAALSDADLSIQTFIEVALLARYPEVRFFGEEYASSHNTKYFSGNSFGEAGELLALLDPIDGTRFYIDQHDNYQILFGLMSERGFEAAVALTPRRSNYFYAVRGKGAFIGDISNDLKECKPLKINAVSNRICLGGDTGLNAASFAGRFEVVDPVKDYKTFGSAVGGNDILNGKFVACVARNSQFIDSALLAFIASEAGAIMTDFSGNPMPLATTCRDFKYPSMVVALGKEVHADIIEVTKKVA